MRTSVSRPRVALALFTLLALPLRGEKPLLPDLPQGVRQAVDVEDAEAEEVVAGSDAALWLPKLHVVRWVPLRSEALPRFLADAEGLSTALESGALGPWLLKRPGRADLLPELALRRTVPSPQAQVLFDGFENLANWDLSDNRSGAYTFAASTCAAHGGSRSADAVRGGGSGQSVACNSGYPTQTVTQILHKSCEALSGASQAWLDFYLAASLTNAADSIGIYYNDPQGQYWGYTFTGPWSAWYHVVQSLKQWYKVNDVTAVACPKLLIQFSSGSSPASGFGARIDDLTVGTDTPSFLRATITPSPASGPAPLAVSFSAAVGGASGGETYSWRFGDSGNSTSALQSPSFTYTAAGDYYPRLIVFGNNVLASAQTKVHVDEPCTLSCTATVPASGTAGAAVAFAASISGCTGTPTWAWTFGDGQTSTQQNPSHTYASAGTYAWSVTATLGQACTKNGSITVTGGGGSLPGDCNGDGRVDIGEVQKAINMLLGVQAIGCGVDANANGQVSIDELQRVINAFLGGGSGGISVSVSPPTATILAGATQAFTASVSGSSNQAVTWSVQEGSTGGSVTSGGLYTAPQTSGLYHVVATSQADATKSGSAAVTVGATSSQKGIVYGTVKDTGNAGLGDVVVTVGALTASTNGQGYFTINDVPTGTGVLVAFSKTGYVPTTKVIPVSSGQGTYLGVNLATAKPGQPITVSTGGTVNTPEGGSATFPPDAFVTPSGTPHSGTANVSLTVFDPTNPAHLNAFPGQFQGVTTGGQTIFFVTFGWMDVTATTTTGGQLNLAPGKTATIKIPVPAAIQSGAPATLPEWYFDASAGVWRQEGTFTYSGGAYTGSIPHLSVWNCDVGAARCTITGRVVDLTGAPIQCAQVSMLNLGPRGRFTSGEYCTGSDGRFAVPVDANSSVQITASKGGVSSSPVTTDTCVDGGTRDVGDIVLGTPPVKVTLTWGQSPSDLDSHMAVPNASGSGYAHVYFSNKTAEQTSLDTDDTSSFGPEIVTVLSLHTGTYRYSVHQWSSAGTISASPAAVNLLIEGQGLFTFTAPAGGTGQNDLWQVFDLVVDANKHATLHPINRILHGISSSSDPAFFP